MLRALRISLCRLKRSNRVEDFKKHTKLVALAMPCSGVNFNRVVVRQDPPGFGAITM